MINTAGTLQTDEYLTFPWTETIDGDTYYVDYLAQANDDGIAQSLQSTQCVYLGAGKTSTRLTVALAGYPAESTDIVLRADLGGKVYKTTNTPVYVTYNGHGEFNRTPKMKLVYDGNMQSGTTADWIIEKVSHNLSVSRVAWHTNEIAGFLPNAAVTLYLRDAVSGGGNAWTLALGTVNDSNRGGNITLATTATFDTSKLFVIRGDGKGIGKLTMEFF